MCKDGKYRSFSIVSSPNTQGMIELHIRITEYSIPIFKNILIKDNVVGLKGPFGTCTNIQELVFPTILLAEGLGLASFFSALNDLKVPTNNLLIIWLRHAEDHDYASPQIALWEKEIKNVSFVVIEKPNNNYTKIKSYCDNFVAKNKKICLCIAGSKKVRDFMIDNCIARNSKNYIKLLYDI